MRPLTLRSLSLCLFGVAGALLGTAAVQQVHAARKAPRVDSAVRPETVEIKSSAANAVPSCVLPDRLMLVLTERNPKLEVRFKAIAGDYKRHGEALGVRWDYAFYQMILETNYLAFNGDVKVAQNNFAGLGATGGGVRGESFPDVSTGVLAHLQHLVAYSGVMVQNPVAKRTRDNQDGIVAASKKLGRAVRFADLTNRWAADKKYANSIELVATRFRDSGCSGKAEPVAAATPLVTEETTADTVAGERKSRRKGRDLAKKAIDDGKSEAAAVAGLGATKLPANNPNCGVMTASFGGSVTLLIRAETAQGIMFTALGVDGGAEDAMADNYIRVHAPSGKVSARFKSRDEAVNHAYALCDSGKP
jgi:Mannosyl-glycoprotein endo-beta-N-acetylglucosaminidase